MIYPVILSGGSGSRLWPLSRELYPKQFQALTSDKPMIAETVLRLSGDGFAPPLVVCNESHRFLVAASLQALDVEPTAIILEPVARNTAPAITAAAMFLLERDPEAVMVVAPSDHVIAVPEVLTKAIQLLAPRLRVEAAPLVTFGITPNRPETGYGYIALGPEVLEEPRTYSVSAFTEKPDARSAQEFVDGGRHFWNAGIFMFSAAALLAEMERYASDLVAAVRVAIDRRTPDLDFLRLAGEAFSRAPSISIDYAIMERTERAWVCPLDAGWSDVGSWQSMWDVSDKGPDGSVTIGDVITLDSQDCYLRAEPGLLLATAGLRNLVAVATQDAVLIADRASAQEVKKLAERLKSEGREEHAMHRLVRRPWGTYETIDRADGFVVKRITVDPGASLSLQYHNHRAEHWVVVRGTAHVTCDDREFELGENESTYVPKGSTHRLENRGDTILHLIEVQTGKVLDEDDIVRLDDVYGRGAASAREATD